MKGRFVLFCLWFLLPVSIQAQEKKDKDDSTHQELREATKSMSEAFRNKDLDSLLKHVHKKVVVVWQNGEVSNGHDGIRKNYERILAGPSSVMDKAEIDPKLADSIVLHGSPADAAVVFGDLNDVYTLRDGTTFAMKSRFSATFAKQDDQWLVVAFHASADVWDNDILKTAVGKSMWLAGGISGIAALIAGIIFGRALGAKKTT
jgi:ketosteroid isomerase-like protein